MKVNSTADLVTESTGDLTAEKNPKKFRNMNNSERFEYVREIVTVEPVISIYILAVYICSPALGALETLKACHSDGGIERHICDAIVEGRHENYSAENEIQQEIVARTNLWASTAEQAVPIILVFFLGSFSDRYKMRKIFIIIPLVGELFAVIGCIINWYFLKEMPLLWLVILNKMVSSFFGNLTLLVMALFAYIADNSTVEMRTLRVGLLQISIKIFGTIGSYLTGPLYAAIGILYVFIITWFLILIAVLYAIFFVKEKREVKLGNKLSMCKDIFNTSDLVGSVSLLVKKTAGCNRLFLCLVLFISFCATVAAAGPLNILRLFTQKVFLWSPDQHAMYVAVSATLGLIGSSLGIFLVTKVIKLSDYNIINMTLLLSAISEIISAFSTNSSKSVGLFYFASVVAMCGGLNTIGIRSISTKISTEDNTGKVQSLMAITEAVSYSVAASYNKIYIDTAATFPGAFFLVSALISCLTGGLVLLLNVLITRDANKKADLKAPEINDLELNGMQMATTHI